MTQPQSEATPARRFFLGVTARPRSVLLLGFLVVAVAAAFLPSLRKDTDTDAFVPRDHPTRVANDEVYELFGVSDDLSIVVAIIRDAPGGVFDPDTLRLVMWLTERIEQIPGVVGDQVSSLSTEKNLVGTGDSLIIEPFLEDPPTTAEEAQRVRDAVLDYDLYVDSLVTRDGTATAIVVEINEEEVGKEVYEAILALIDEGPVRDESIYVAGLGAYTAIIGDYIDADLERLNPIVALVIMAVLFAAYRTWRGVVLPGLIALGAVSCALGLMAAVGVPLYGISASMTVIVIAIAVCDGIHLLGGYYGAIASEPGISSREAIVRAACELWRPVTVTSVTTTIGFLSISAGTDMPPLREYGIFASVGVASAWFFSLFSLPAALSLLPARPSRAITASRDGGLGAVSGWTRRPRSSLARIVHDHPLPILGAGVLVLIAGAVGADRLERDNEYHRYLNPWEPLYQAEVAINQTLGGIQSLNVVMDSGRPDGLYDPDYLRLIEGLQQRVDGMPHVKKSTSIVDLIKRMHRVMNGYDPEYYAIPDDRSLIAQYFLLYSMSGDPTDLEELVDSEHRRANIWISFDRSRWSDARTVVPAVEDYLASSSNGAGKHSKIAGIMNLSYHLDQKTARSQRNGIALAFLSIGVVLAISYRSLTAALLGVLPVSLAVLLTYAAMGYLDIWLSFATSMTASISVGISVDFAIHTFDHLAALLRGRRRNMAEAFATLFSSTGRALIFNWLAILLGFGVLAMGSVPTVREFGMLVGVCVTASLLASLTLLPALVRILRPRFLCRPGPDAPER